MNREAEKGVVKRRGQGLASRKGNGRESEALARGDTSSEWEESFSEGNAQRRQTSERYPKVRKMSGGSIHNQGINDDGGEGGSMVPVAAAHAGTDQDQTDESETSCVEEEFDEDEEDEEEAEWTQDEEEGAARRASPSAEEQNSQEEIEAEGPQQRHRTELMWDAMYEKLKKFRNQFGHCRVPNRYEPDPSLGAWVSTQRRQYKAWNGGKSNANDISKSTRKPSFPERVRRLNKLGFAWVSKNPRHVPWETRYEELCDFQRKYGHCLVPVGYEDNVSLSYWVSTQRQEYKSLIEGLPSKMTQRRLKQLERLGFVWDALRVRNRNKVVSLDSVRSRGHLEDDESEDTCEEKSPASSRCSSPTPVGKSQNEEGRVDSTKGNAARGKLKEPTTEQVGTENRVMEASVGHGPIGYLHQYNREVADDRHNEAGHQDTKPAPKYTNETSELSSQNHNESGNVLNSSRLTNPRDLDNLKEPNETTEYAWRDTYSRANNTDIPDSRNREDRVDIVRSSNFERNSVPQPDSLATPSIRRRQNREVPDSQISAGVDPRLLETAHADVSVARLPPEILYRRLRQFESEEDPRDPLYRARISALGGVPLQNDLQIATVPTAHQALALPPGLAVEATAGPPTTMLTSPLLVDHGSIVVPSVCPSSVLERNAAPPLLVRPSVRNLLLQPTDPDPVHNSLLLPPVLEGTVAIADPVLLAIPRARTILNPVATYSPHDVSRALALQQQQEQEIARRSLLGIGLSREPAIHGDIVVPGSQLVKEPVDDLGLLASRARLQRYPMSLLPDQANS